MINFFCYLKYRFDEFFYGGAPIMIPKGTVVLEIASGGKPYWRSDILVDKFVSDDSERDSSIVIDRDFVIADISRLPFRDKSVDFVIARHIFEHVPDLAALIRELERVGKAGYIETPSSFSESLFGWPFHAWEIDTERGALLVRPKNTQINIHLKKLKPFFDTDADLRSFSRMHRDLFYTRHYWQGEIRHSIADGALPALKAVESVDTGMDNFSLKALRASYSFRRKIRIFIDRIRRAFIARSGRYRLASMLVCVRCGGALRPEGGDAIVCANNSCRARFSVRDGLPILL